MNINGNQNVDVDFKSVAEDQLNTLKIRLQEIDGAIGALQIERRVLTEKTSALEKVLDAWIPRTSGHSAETGEESRMEPSPKSTTHLRRSGRLNPADLAVKILSDLGGEPVHYRELADEVFKQGGDLPEGSPAPTLNAMMNQDNRFVRPFRRGYYALRKDHPNVKRSVGTRRRKRS